MKALRTAGCPDWCCLAHGDDSPISHETYSIAIPVGGGEDEVEFLEVRTVQYLTNDPAANCACEPVPFVEIAYRVDGRYRLINMSTVQVRVLVDALLRCVDAADSA